MTLTIITLSSGYALLGAILLFIAIRAPMRWQFKAGLIVTTSAFFIIAFEATRSLLGWAAVRPLPERFKLLWTRVVEPSRAYNEAGAIYLWVEELDENNVPSGAPRAYKVRYTQPLAEKVEKAQSDIIAGKPQEGTSSDLDSDGQNAPQGAQTAEASAPMGEAAREGTNPVDPEFLQNAPNHLEFAPLAQPLLPVKPGN